MAGLGPVPPWPTARTSKRWRPGFTVTECGEVQGANGAPSRRHSNRAAGSLEAKRKATLLFGFLLVRIACGWETIEVFGGVGAGMDGPGPGGGVDPPAPPPPPPPLGGGGGGEGGRYSS